MHVFAYPHNAHHRHDIINKGPNTIHTNSVLNECEAFNEDIVGGTKLWGISQEIGPRSFCWSMVFVVSIENGVESRCIDKNTHLLYASDK